MTERSVLIVADDLTGACDTAGAVVSISGPVPVRLEGRARPGEGAAGTPAGDVGPVAAIDLDSRAATVLQAVERTIAAVSTAPGDVYLKIDSTLRGHIVPTVAAAGGTFRARHPDAQILVCPAFPARRRLVAARRMVVDGRVVESSVLDELAALPGVEVADAASDEDLEALVRAAGGAPRLWVGSAGLAPHAVAALFTTPPPAPRPVPPAHVVGVVVGSAQPASVSGADRLAGDADGRLRVVVGDPRRPTFADEALEAVRGVDALVVTGGYTARRLLERLGVAELRVCGELEPGIPWCTSDGPVPMIVTKAGGFGDVDTLRRLVDRLHGAAQSA